MAGAEQYHLLPLFAEQLAREKYRKAVETEKQEKAFARRTDPPTSHAAAESVKHIRESQEAVLYVLRRFGPFTDPELIAKYQEVWSERALPQQSESGIRTRRHELEVMQKVEGCGFRVGQSRRNMTVWRAK